MLRACYQAQNRFSLAFITGASSGIGAGICRLLAIQGVPLFITGRNYDALKALADELQDLVSVEFFVADLSLEIDRRHLLAKIYERVPDLIINAAGFGLYGKALTFETHQQLSMIDVNVSALLEITLEGARRLASVEKRGVILNISSSADFLVFPGLAVYAATKAFVTQFSRSFDEEMRKVGIRILASCPGVVNSKFRRRAAGGVNSKPDKLAMTVPFAAQQILDQIFKAKQIHRFNWKTKIAAFFARNFFPQTLVSKILFRITESYHPSRSLIKSVKRSDLDS